MDYKKEKLVGYKGINNAGADFKVIAYGEKVYDKRKLYTVKFDKSGYIGYFTKKNILSGSIRDPYFPHIYGIGYLGNISVKATYTSGEREFEKWKAMISRCYNINDSRYHNYGAKGITVCERWHSFENFFNDLPYLPGFNDYIKNPSLYQLDKDTLQVDVCDNNKIYSPDTCIFLSIRLNTLEKHYRANLNSSGYKGVFIAQSGYYYVRVEKDYFGTYTDPIIAANVYNHVASYREYPEEYLNNVQFVPWMKCMGYRLMTRGRIKMVDILDKQKHKCITDITDLKTMCKIVK